MAQNTFNDPELNTFQKEFDHSVRKRQRSLIAQSLVPRALPPVFVGTAFSSTVLFDMWEHIPHELRVPALIACAGTALASSFVHHKKAGSPFVDRNAAIRAIDKEIGDPYDTPARAFNDVYPNSSSPEQISLREASKKKHWKKWQNAITGQSLQNSISTYFVDNKLRQGLYGAVILSAVFGAAMHGPSFEHNFQTIFEDAPVPPLAYTATILPPKEISNTPVYTDTAIKTALQNQSTITPHDQSIFELTSYDRPATIIINGVALEPIDGLDEAQGTQQPFQNLIEMFNTQEKESPTYHYSLPLETGITSIAIEGYTLTLDIKPDMAPELNVLSSDANPRYPTHVSLEYTLRDDHGVTSAEAQMGASLDEDGKIRAPVFESHALPTITLPH